jgi:hypothetical protein
MLVKNTNFFGGRMKKSLVIAALNILAVIGMIGSFGTAEAGKPLTLRIGHPMAPGNNVTVGYENSRNWSRPKATRRSAFRFSAAPSWAATA